MRIAAYVLSFLSIILNVSLFVKLKPPYSFYFVMPQLMAAALSPILAILGAAGAVLGWTRIRPYPRLTSNQRQYGLKCLPRAG